jgi:hypothetical protein
MFVGNVGGFLSRIEPAVPARQRLLGSATWRLQSAKDLPDDLLNNKGPQRTGGPHVS